MYYCTICIYIYIYTLEFHIYHSGLTCSTGNYTIIRDIIYTCNETFTNSKRISVLVK